MYSDSVYLGPLAEVFRLPSFGIPGVHDRTGGFGVIMQDTVEALDSPSLFWSTGGTKLLM
jgi:hypothetical protein